MMRPRLTLVGALLVVLTSGCTGSDDAPERTLPAVKPSQVVPDEPDEPATSSPMPTPTCGVFSLTRVSKVGSGFIVELNIMSGLPNPAWRLTKAEGLEFHRLLQTTRRGIDMGAPDELGGLGVRADRGAVGLLRRLELPKRFWVRGDNLITDFLRGTAPCNPKVS